jgi:hypothetical protein
MRPLLFRSCAAKENRGIAWTWPVAACISPAFIRVSGGRPDTAGGLADLLLEKQREERRPRGARRRRMGGTRAKRLPPLPAAVSLRRMMRDRAESRLRRFGRFWYRRSMTAV